MSSAVLPFQPLGATRVRRTRTACLRVMHFRHGPAQPALGPVCRPTPRHLGRCRTVPKTSGYRCRHRSLSFQPYVQLLSRPNRGARTRIVGTTPGLPMSRSTLGHIPGNTTRVHVIVVSPVQVFCEALREALSRDKLLRVLEQQGSLNKIAALCKGDPHIVIVCDGSSSEALRFFAAASRRLARCRLVVFGVRSSRAFRSFAAVGAKGLVSRDATLKELSHAIKIVHEYGSFVSPALQSHAIDAFRRGPVRRLTDRERDIASLISRRLTNKQIAARLRVSEHTVKVHVRHILSKLDARGRTEVSAAIARS